MVKGETCMKQYLHVELKIWTYFWKEGESKGIIVELTDHQASVSI